MKLQTNFKELNKGLGSSLVSVFDLSDICLTKECKERQQQTEIQKQQILANAIENTTKNVIDDAAETIKIIKYVAFGVGGIALISLIIYATKDNDNDKKR
jgi:hypothetical protein